MVDVAVTMNHGERATRIAQVVPARVKMGEPVGNRSETESGRQTHISKGYTSIDIAAVCSYSG
jgi:hypothetical protein